MPVHRNMTLQHTCCPDTWLNMSSHTRVYLANKMGPSSDSESMPAVFYVSPLSVCLRTEACSYGWLYYPDIIIPSLPYRELIWSTNGVSLEARIAHNQSNVPLSGCKFESMAGLCCAAVFCCILSLSLSWSKVSSVTQFLFKFAF